jgi:hypothetical protein
MERRLTRAVHTRSLKGKLSVNILTIHIKFSYKNILLPLLHIINLFNMDLPSIRKTGWKTCGKPGEGRRVEGKRRKAKGRGLNRQDAKDIHALVPQEAVREQRKTKQVALFS